MKTSIVDLRYKMKDVLKALDRRENIHILYHGKLKGIIMPAQATTKKRIQDHPFFAMFKGSKKSVKKLVDDLRGPRYAV